MPELTFSRPPHGVMLDPDEAAAVAQLINAFVREWPGTNVSLPADLVEWAAQQEASDE